MKAVVAAFNQEKALVGAFSVITNLRMQLFEALVKAVHAVGGSVDVVPVSRLTEHGAYNLTLKPAQLYTTRIVVAVSHVPVLPLNGKFSERVMNLVNPDLIFSAHDHQGYLFTADRCARFLAFQLNPITMFNSPAHFSILYGFNGFSRILIFL